MIEILQELDAASTLLRAALDRYLSACFAIQGCHTTVNAANRFPPELSRRVTDELPQVSSYEAKLKEAKTAMNLSRNSCTDIAPINSLPDEILSRIFNLVLDAQLRATDNGLQPLSPNQINICSLVCCRWRQVSISLGTLWSRIDINLAGSSKQHLARAMVHAARAGHAPLDVRISDNFYADVADPLDGIFAEISQFLASIAPRIRSLTLSINCYGKLYPTVTRACFASCVPGVLTRLALDARSDYRFFEAAEEPQMESQLIEVHKQVLEDLWLHVTVLQLHRFYLPWTSKAYHGLTRLHFTGSAFNAYISKQQLIKILESSPQLRVFHFGLRIIDPFSADPLVPVHLECLEVLVWESTYADQLGTFLRLLTPGSSPLQVSIVKIRHQDSVLLDEMKRFFTRSNVTKLCMRPGDDCKLTPDLLDSLPPLELLTLQYFLIEVPPFPSGPTGESDSRSARPCFRALHLMRCRTRLDALPQMVERHSIQKLRIWPGDICSDSIGSYRKGGIIEEEINEQLHAICPDAEFLGWGNPAPTKGWAEALA